MSISVIIPCHNDNFIINDTIHNLLDNNREVDEIIVVDDMSWDDVDRYIKIRDSRIKVLRTEENNGVGAAFDVGASVAKGDVLYLMGSDIRFDNNGAIKRMSRFAEDNPKTIVGCECVGIDESREFVPVNTSHLQMIKDDQLGKRHRLLGSTILWKMTNKDLTSRNPHYIDDAFRDIIQAKWMRHTGEVDNVIQVPCVHGATYAVTKKWYDHIAGFKGHRVWGGLEPMISIKSYLAGGDCKVMSDVYTGHMFGRGVGRNSNMWAKYYNKVYMAMMFFDKEIEKELLDHVMVWRPPMVAKEEIQKNWNSKYKAEKEFYQKMFVRDIRDTILWNSWTENALADNVVSLH